MSRRVVTQRGYGDNGSRRASGPQDGVSDTGFIKGEKGKWRRLGLFPVGSEEGEAVEGARRRMLEMEVSTRAALAWTVEMMTDDSR